MENFKSFGRKVVIPFFPGFTAITGPNGSGKSNIGDAIRFVLGPKSPKSIRAERLVDLIFDGGKDKKKPANYCEVSLVFDNSDRKLPIDSDTVVLTRRIKRAPLKDNPENFYSYFYINGKSASLTDFVNLLTRARISGDGYNLVKQGDVTSLVEMGPVERRKIIDDVAGISEFDREIEKAEKEKKEVEENIQRINIILEEINRQLSQLKKERDEAIRYRELQDKLRELKAKVTLKKKLDIESQIGEIQEQIESYEKEKERLEREREEKKKRYDEIKKRLEEIERKISEGGGEEAKRISQQINELRTGIAKIEERISNLRDSVKSMKQRRMELRKNLENLEGRIRSIDGRIKELISEKEKEEKEKERMERELERIRKGLEESDRIYRELAKLREEYNDLLQRKHEICLEKERLEEKLKALDSKLSELKETRETYSFELKDISWRIEEAKREKIKLTKRKEQLERRLFEKKKEEAELNQQLREVELAVRSLEREYSRLRAEYDAQESVRKGYTTAVIKILEARDRGELKGIHGTVAELAKVDEKYEIAMQVAGGNRLQAIIVDDDETAARAIEYLRKNNLGRATFLPLNKMISGKPRAKALLAVEDEKSHGFALDLISFKKEYEPAFWYVFGDTVVVEDLDTARKWMGGVRLVTLQGDLIESSGAMIGGTVERMNVFSKIDRSRLDEIEDKLRKAMESRDSLIGKLDNVRREIEDIQKEKRELEGRTIIDISDLEARRKEFEGKLKIIEEDLEKAGKEKEEVESRIASLEKELKSLENRVKEIESIKEEKGKLVVNRDVSRRIKEMEGKLLELKERILSLDGEAEALSKEKGILESRVSEMKTEIDGLEKEMSDREKEIEKLKGRKSEDMEKLEALISLESSKAMKIKGLSEEKERIYREMVRLETEMDKVSTRIESYVDLISRARYRLDSLEDALKEMDAELSRFSDVMKRISDEDIPSIESLMESIREVEENLHELEPVNMRALEEYEHQSERKRKLEDDIKKLREQKRNLNRVTKEIAKKKRDRFYEVFNEINKNFKEIYSRLSNGDQAYLELENPDDPFSGGMIIKVKPKGKKLQNLSSLSGGEKSMASLALIFAIQRYDPSPFYVLDEIDMYLDNVNAEAVSKMIKENSSYAQFILISLRKVTLKEADHIYGITKREDGISEVVGTVDLSSIGPRGEILSGGRKS